MFFPTIVITSLLASVLVEASPIAPKSCGTSTYGPFKLYAKQEGSSDSQLVRLINVGSDSNNNTISTMTVCENCGIAPAYWTLADAVLTPHLFNNVEGQATVNMPLNQGKINFVTGDEASVTKSGAYCAVRNSSAGRGLPGFLAVNGDADGFSICSFVGTPGPVHRRDIYFNQASNGIARNCKAAHLILQSIGIVAEPIPTDRKSVV